MPAAAKKSTARTRKRSTGSGAAKPSASGQRKRVTQAAAKRARAAGGCEVQGAPQAAAKRARAARGSAVQGAAMQALDPPRAEAASPRGATRAAPAPRTPMPEAQVKRLKEAAGAARLPPHIAGQEDPAAKK